MTLPKARRRGLIALGAAAAALATVFPVSAHAVPGAPADPAVPPAASAPSDTSPATGAPRTVTLVTGDKVTVTTTADGHTSTTVTGPDGRSADAHVMTQGEDTWVYPDAALPYLASGVLDPHLFNVRELLADGYDDAHSDHLPLIVSYTDAAFRSRATAVPKGARRTLTLNSVQGAPAPPPAARRRASPPARRCTSARCSPTAAPASTPGASPAWNGPPRTSTPGSSA